MGKMGPKCPCNGLYGLVDLDHAHDVRQALLFGGTLGHGIGVCVSMCLRKSSGRQDKEIVRLVQLLLINSGHQSQTFC